MPQHFCIRKAARNTPHHSNTLLADEGRMTGFTTIKIRWWQIRHTLSYIKKCTRWEISCDHALFLFLLIRRQWVRVSIVIYGRWKAEHSGHSLVLCFFVSNIPNVVSLLSWGTERKVVFSFTCVTLSNCQLWIRFDTSVAWNILATEKNAPFSAHSSFFNERWANTMLAGGTALVLLRCIIVVVIESWKTKAFNFLLQEGKLGEKLDKSTGHSCL